MIDNIDLKINGKLFPIWIIQKFKKYKLELPNELVDPCKNINLELTLYQKFLGDFLSQDTKFKDILIYHGLGTGKTISAINIYNVLYNKDKNINVFLLIKASLKNDPWKKDLDKWLINSDINENDIEKKYNNIHWIYYDSPNSEKMFMEVIKKSDINKKNLYIIDEVHNFINSVYNNIKSSVRNGKSLTIYNYIINEKKNNDTTRIILLSATPVINQPFELGLLFNLLRYQCFPNNENTFNELFINSTKTTLGNDTINKNNINLFQRRIIGLVSYYKGNLKNIFAKKIIKNKFIKMSNYQENIFKHYQKIENKIKSNNKNNLLFSIYTRLVCNFVFPELKNINPLSRFNINKDQNTNNTTINTNDINTNDINTNNINTNNINTNDINTNDIEKINIIKELIKYFEKINNNDIKNNHTIYTDIENYKNKYNYKFKKFITNENKKSYLFENFYKYSCKMTYIIFNIFKSKGPIVIYSNFVNNEGLEILKIYLKFINFEPFNNLLFSKVDTLDNQNSNKQYYIEFYGGISPEIRSQNIIKFNDIDNIYGNIIKILLLAPAGSEGLNLLNVRQVHILDPYWNNIRIKQVIGRAVRNCSHKDLPLEERSVYIYKYYSKLENKQDITTDIKIKKLAKQKNILLSYFLKAIKQVSIDCQLFYNHNYNNKKKFKCFNFGQENYLENNIGPAYLQNINNDINYNDGLNAINSVINKIKVVEINAISLNIINTKLINNSQFDERNIKKNILNYIKKYWYDPNTFIIYEYEFNYPIGKIKLLNNNVPDRFDINTYIYEELNYIN